MFVDYYALFEVTQSASSDEIKIAFRRQALKWHPDRNQGIDTTEKMQLLNEAKLILLDEEARLKYDYQYQRFNQYKQEKEKTKQQEYSQQKSSQQKKEQQTHKPFTQTYTYSDFDVDDEALKRWMANAKRQAVDLAKQTIEELKGMTKAGIKAGGKAIGNAFVYQIIFSVIIMIILGLAKACN